MFVLKAAFCRVFQGAFRLVLPVLPYREPEIIPSCEDLGCTLRQAGVHSVLIVTDKGIVEHGLAAPLVKILESNGLNCAVFDGTQPNPTVKNVEDALAYYKAQNCDGIVAIGGGSSMDCAKALGARVAHPKKSLAKMRGILRVYKPLPPLAAIPTTAGTGSEITLAAVITDADRKDKYALMSFPLIPRWAVLDPAMTYSLPPHLTATTGMDALTHAVEAYIGRSTTRQTRQLALEATALVFGNIRTAYESGTHRQARRNMLLAAYKAGEAFSKSYVGYVHAMAHALGGQYGTPHGLANAVILPWVLEAYGSSAYKKLHDLGVAAGVCTADASHKEGAEAFIRAVRGLNRQMGIPEKLPGILKPDIPALAKHAEKEANPLYPVPRLMETEELAELFEKISDWREEP